MRELVRTLNLQHGLILGGTVVWGVVEFMALQRRQLQSRARRVLATTASAGG